MISITGIPSKINHSTPKKQSNVLSMDFDSLNYYNETIKFTEDPIVLACAKYRASIEGNFFADIVSVEVVQEDRETAQKIKKYYSDRYAMMVLRGFAMSEFRKKLYAIMNDNAPIKREEVGLLYKLPYFYQEDIALENLAVMPFEAVKKPLVSASTSLTPVTSYATKRKGDTGVHYWWKSSENYLVQWPVAGSNPLFSLVKGLYERQKPIALQATFEKMQRTMSGTLHYYRVTNPTLVFNET